MRSRRYCRGFCAARSRFYHPLSRTLLSLLLLSSSSLPLPHYFSLYPLYPFAIHYLAPFLLYIIIASLSLSRESAIELAIPQIVTTSYRTHDRFYRVFLSVFFPKSGEISQVTLWITILFTCVTYILERLKWMEYDKKIFKSIPRNKKSVIL